VVIIDEVCTEGKSILEAIDVATTEKCEVLGVISLVDREQGGSEKVRQLGYSYQPIFTARELMKDVEQSAVTRTNAGASGSSIHR
jgi:orotate phosphoribosyltransferase